MLIPPSTFIHQLMFLCWLIQLLLWLDCLLVYFLRGIYSKNVQKRQSGLDIFESKIRGKLWFLNRILSALALIRGILLFLFLLSLKGLSVFCSFVTIKRCFSFELIIHSHNYRCITFHNLKLKSRKRKGNGWRMFEIEG